MSQFPAHRAATASAASGAWSDHKVDLLTSLWKAGDLSASQIAQRLGVTRNAVLGKVFRLGLSGSRPPAVRLSKPMVGTACRGPRRPSPRPAAAAARDAACGRRAAAGVRAGAAGEAPVADVAQVTHLEDLTDAMCCWPCGDPKADDFGFCGALAVGGPYCPGHARRAFRPGGRAAVTDLLRLAARIGA